MCKRWENVQQGIVMGEHQVKIVTFPQGTLAQDKLHLYNTSYICTRLGTFAQDKVQLHKTRYTCPRKGTFAQGSVI